MTKSNSTKRALISSTLAILMCVAMLIGTTFAWFTDTASTAVNKIQSGKLDVALEMRDSDGNWVSAEGKTLTFKTKDNRSAKDILWEPGCTYELPELRVVNKGNLALKYKVVVSGIQGDAKLNEVIDWSMTVDGSPAEDLNSIIDKILEPEADSGSIIISGHMDESAGNDYQNLSIDGIAVTVYATQAVSEYDSYENTYDKKAEYGELVTTKEEFTAALAAGKDVILAADITLESELNINKNAAIYGNGHTVMSGAPVRVASGNNVTFKNVRFDAPVNAKNNASNLYASGLKGTLVLDGCVFSGTQWDSVQILPETGAEIVINNCKFELNSAAPASNKTRFIHIEAKQDSNADVKITLTNNFFGASTYINNALIDIDYINLDGIDFGGNNIYTDTDGDIYVCGPNWKRTITKDEAYKKLGALKAVDNTVISNVTGDTAIVAGSTVAIDSATTIAAGATISGDSKDSSTLNVNNSQIKADDVTIKDLTINGKGSAGTGGTLNIGGNNTTIENVDYKADGNIAIAVSTGKNNSGTVFKNTKITNAFRGIQFWSLSGDSVIDNCTLDISGYTFNIDAAVAGSTLTIKNSVLNGWTSYTNGIKLVSFENCKLGLNTYDYLRPYSETKITDCEFTSDSYLLNAGGTGTYTITIDNCTKNGVAITANNVRALLLDTEDWNVNATLVVNGTVVSVQ